MAAVTIHSDFGAQDNKIRYYLHLNYHDIEWFALEMNELILSWDCTQVLHFRLFCCP